MVCSCYWIFKNTYVCLLQRSLETVSLNLDFMLLTSQNVLKEDLKNLFVITLNNYTEKKCFWQVACIRVE